MTTLEYFDENKRVGLLISYLIAILIGVADYGAGSSLSLTLFYFIPIVFVVWSSGLNQGLLISAVNTIIWIFADVSSREVSPGVLNVILNAAIVMGIFSSVAILLSQLKTSIEREKMLARIDPLTGLANNQAFLEIVTDETKRSMRYPRPLTLVYLDCDHFKNINDSYGHETGNQLLMDVATTIKRVIRATDKAGRMGGDEFIILLPETNNDDSKNVIIRLQKALNDVMQRNNWNITFSIGVATFVTVIESVNEMIIQADRLMYSAKKEGKNRAVYQTFSNRSTS